MDTTLESLQDQGQFDELMAQAEAIVKPAETEGRALKRAELINLQGVLSQATAIKERMDARMDSAAISGKLSKMLRGFEDKTASLDYLVSTSDFVRPAKQQEGVIPGLSSTKSGEMYAFSPEGEDTLNTLKSGSYKDAQNEYIRSAGLGRPVAGSAMKILQEGIDEQGGFWVTPDFRTDVVKKIAAVSQIRDHAFVFSTNSDLASFPKVTWSTDDIYTSGTRFAWIAENLANNVTEATNLTAGRMQIPVNISLAVTLVTRQMLEDPSFDLLNYLGMVFGDAFSVGESAAFWSGDGVAKPQGLLNHPNAQILTASGGMQVKTGNATQLNWGLSSPNTTGIVGLDAAMPGQYDDTAKWYANKTTYGAIRTLTDTSQRPLWNDYAQANHELLDSPTLKDANAPSVAANAFPLVKMADNAYFIADRVGMSIQVLHEAFALRDMVGIVCRRRVGGQLVKDWACKVLRVAV